MLRLGGLARRAVMMSRCPSLTALRNGRRPCRFAGPGCPAITEDREKRKRSAGPICLSGYDNAGGDNTIKGRQGWRNASSRTASGSSPHGQTISENLLRHSPMLIVSHWAAGTTTAAGFGTRSDMECAQCPSGNDVWKINVAWTFSLVMPGLVPGIHAFATAAGGRFERVDAHGSSPWAEGPRDEPGHDVL
jgi:hypothetical protein